MPGPPSREAELALLLVGTRARRERVAGRIAELAGAADHTALMAALARQRVLALVGARLLDVPTVSPWSRRWIEAYLLRARVRARGFTAATGAVADALAAGGIAAVPLKGATLATELYGDPALRNYEDIDILVPCAALGEAARVVAALGWSVDDADSSALPRLHRELRHPDERLPVVELHWRIHWYEREFAETVLRRSRVDRSVRRLAPTDQLACLLLFYARDGFAGLRYPADIAAWWDLHGNGSVVPALGRLIDEYPALAEAWRAALAAAAPASGLPAAVLTAASRPRRRRTAAAARLANWDLRGDADQIIANVTLIDGLLAPRRDLAAFARRRILRGGRHACKLVLRYAVAWWRVRGRRSWSPPAAVP